MGVNSSVAKGNPAFPDVVVKSFDPEPYPGRRTPGGIAPAAPGVRAGGAAAAAGSARADPGGEKAPSVMNVRRSEPAVRAPRSEPAVRT
jgi:hypothetical protein